jgi:hypothetical protein
MPGSAASWPNYDGARKNPTILGGDEHSGSNGALISPIVFGASKPALRSRARGNHREPAAACQRRAVKTPCVCNVSVALAD